jgi:hypothetical protein
MSARPPSPVVADGEIVGKTCPICQTQIVRGESVVACPSCKLDYHHECWKENGGCGAYGCEQAPETKKTPVKADDQQDVAWGGEKRCPECRQSIKAQALVCHHCKAQFWTRDPISPEAWTRREVTGGDLSRAQTLLVALFLASACGCLFPITGVFTAVWIFGGMGPYPVVRLPTTLQVLLKACFGVSCTWAFVAIVIALSNL